MASPSAAQIEYQWAHVEDDRRPDIAVSNGICLGIGVIAILLRFLSRRLARVKLGTDDWLALAGLVLFVLYRASYQVVVHYGLGRHSVLIPNRKGFVVSTIVGATLYNLVIVTIKISILFFYRRIFAQKWFRNCLLGLGAILVMSLIGQVPVIIFQCVPIRSGWDSDVVGKCVDFSQPAMAGGIITVLTDIMLILLPVPVLWNLNAPAQKRWLLILTFMAGGIATIASVVRLFYIHEFESLDPAWGNINGTISSTVELSVGILSVCIPTYRPLYNFCFAKHNLPKNRMERAQMACDHEPIRLRSGDRTWQGHRRKLQSDDNEALSDDFGIFSYARYGGSDATEPYPKCDRGIYVDTQLTNTTSKP